MGDSRRAKNNDMNLFLLAGSEDSIYWYVLLVIKSHFNSEQKRETVESKITGADRNITEGILKKE